MNQTLPFSIGNVARAGKCIYMSSEQSGDAAFWRRVLSAMYRLIALALFRALHYLVERALAFDVPPNMTSALAFAQAVIYVLFLLVYVYLAWDMLAVFVPRLKVAFNAESKILEHDNESQK